MKRSDRYDKRLGRQGTQQGTRHATRRLQRERRPARTFGGYARSVVRQSCGALETHARSVAIVATLALLVAVGVGAGIFGILHSPAANAHAQVARHERGWRLIRAANSSATLARWLDPTNKTALTLRTTKGDAVFQSAASGGVALTSQEPYIFALTLPDGGQIVSVALGQPDASGSLLLSTNTLIYDPATGQVTGTQAASASICDRAVLIAATAREGVTFALRARFSHDGLSAYAELAYAVTGNRIFSAQVGPLSSTAGACSGTVSLASLQGAIVLNSGCPALAADGTAPGNCVDALGIAQQSVTTFDQAVIAQNWAQVYALSAPDITGQYSEAQLAATLGGHASAVGRISTLTVQTNSPTVQFTVGGEAFFAVDQRVTLAQNSSNSTNSMTSYYLFQGGQWLFWFSK